MRTKTTLILLLTVAAFTAASSAIGSHSGSPPCPPTSSASHTGTPVGTVSDVLHSKVYVDAVFVGTTPFGVAPEARICTDVDGEAVFTTQEAKPVKCILLRASAVVMHARPSLAMDYEAGTMWCTFQGAGAIGASRALRISVAAPATVGVAFATTRMPATIVKVWSGTASVTRVARRSVPMQRSVVVSKQRQVVVTDTKAVSATATFSADDRIAIAKLRAAR